MDEVTRILIFTTVFTLTVATILLVSLNINRRRQLLNKKQLLEQQYKTKEEALLQISRDLHDDIGSSLSGINMLSQLAREQIIQHNNSSAAEILQKINGYTSEVIEKVSDMAWLLKPNEESLSILIKKLKAYGMASAASKNIVLHFENQLGVIEKELTIPQRKTIYLVSKEAINNAIKYSLCSNIYYKIEDVDSKIKIEIKDDGAGFSFSEVNGGNGLSNMKARADAADGNLLIHSEQGKGTIVSLEFYLPQLGGASVNSSP
jgi:two-component system, NarL family, sensor histidine kinase UhpB